MKITIQGPQGSGKTSLVEALNTLIQTQAHGFPGIRANFPADRQFKLTLSAGNREEWNLMPMDPAIKAVAYPTEIEKLLASLAEWRDSVASRDRPVGLPEPIPAGWYQHSGSIYSYPSHTECTSGFFHKWKHRLSEFPVLKVPEPVPAGVWFDRAEQSFYSRTEGYLGLRFLAKWKARKDEFPQSAPKPEDHLVPLGENVTTDGRKARVLCIDSLKAGYPVVAEIYDASSEGVLCYYTAAGESRAKHAGSRLVGHLPPEPPKPREFWLTPEELAGLNTTSPNLTTAELLAAGYVLYREVLP